MRRLLRLLKNPYRSIQSVKLRVKFRQRKITMGSDYPDKIFYVIRRIPPGEGMFSNIHNIMAHIKYAVNNHWVPLIDMQNYATRYDMSVPIMGSKNTWEHLFEQPFNYTLDMILHAKNIILSSGYDLPDADIVSECIFDENKIKNNNQIMSKYIRLKKNILEEVRLKKNMVLSNRRVLGVFLRGTDYNSKAKRLRDHQIQPRLQYVIDDAKKYLHLWRCDALFLVTEDADISLAFKKTFGDKVILLPKDRVNSYHGESNPINHLQIDRYSHSVEYITEINILSCCDCFLGSMAGGSIAAFELRGKHYDNQYIYNIGKH